jgi:spectinomycin phosphotransferase
VTNQAGILVPRYLNDQGVAQVVAPLPTTTGTMWAALYDFALILYPFITGNSGMKQGMTPSQWISLGAILSQIHTTPISSELAQLMQGETFVPTGAATVREVEEHIAGRSLADPAAQDLAGIWQERRDTIQALVARAEDLGRQLSQQGLPLVICHADIHTNNVLLDAGGQVWIVDWDETVLAPVERDLMFAVGGGIDRSLVGQHEEDLFLQGYGTSSFDTLALAYYRYAWAVSDIGAYAAQVLFRPDLGTVTKRAAVASFLRLFEPDSIVALALGSDE